MKTIALNHVHQKLNAKMSPFAGFLMPVQYSGITDEHLTVRKALGIFDVSHMGEFIIRGKDALPLVQQLTTNDASKLTPGKVQYSCMTNEKGGIIDDLLVYCLDNETFMLVVNAGNIEKDWKWISDHNQSGAELVNISDKTSLLAVQGPKAVQALQPLTGMDLHKMKYYTFEKGLFAGVENVLVSATGYTGAGGFELYFKNEDAEHIWEKVVEAGSRFGIKPVGLGARDTLRLEMGFCLYGNDIGENNTPIESGLGWITKFSKSFIGAEVLKNQTENGVEKKLVGFEMTEKAIPRHGYHIIDINGSVAGTVTSGTMSPSLQKGIGMGYVKFEFAQPGNEIFIVIRDRSVKAIVKKMPFI